MKEIALTRGKVALVDDEDFDQLNQFGWHTSTARNTFYAATVDNRCHGKRKWKSIYMHRVILGDAVAGMQCDHIDGNGLNNQRSNLRVVTHRQNIQNQHRPTMSRYPGIYFDHGKWVARPRIDGEKKYLGRFSTEEEAFNAYENEVGPCIIRGDVK